MAVPTRRAREDGERLDDIEARAEAKAEAESGAGDGGGYRDATGPESGDATPENVASLGFADLEAGDRPPPPSRRGGRRPGAGRKPGKPTTPDDRPVTRPAGQKHIPNIGVGNEAAAALLAITQGGLMMAIGDPRVALLPSEREQIEPPLARMLARLSPEAATMVATFADPLILGVGLVTWMTRIFTLPKASQRPPAGQPRPPVVPGQPTPIRTELPADGGPPAQPIVNGITNPDAHIFAN